MGSCIICGAPTEGHTCDSHEEDVAFEFRGDSPDQLTPGRYYRGTVDGFAEFGVFIDIGDAVTGLLHKSELDRRLESLDWKPGDSVFVQVTDVRDNGNVDLGWSIRQSEREFRGALIDAPDGDRHPDPDPDPDPGNGGSDDDQPADHGPTAESGSQEGTDGSAGNGSSDTRTGRGSADESEGTTHEADPEAGSGLATTDGHGGSPGTATEVRTPDTSAGTSAETDATGAIEEPDADRERVTIGSLPDRVGDVVRIEGEVAGVRQTSGPTVFTLRDETGTIECAAFEEAGVRAYPDVEVDDAVRLEGEVERRRDSIQVETEALVILDDEQHQAVLDRLDRALEEQADPGAVDPLIDHDPVAAVAEQIRAAATAIRRAVAEGRPVVVRHSATADGYVAGAALERALLPLVRDEHPEADAEYHYVERRPLSDAVYDMDAATGDVTDMLEARDRHGEQLPLVVLVDAGSTLESANGYRLLELYGADRVVIDGGAPDPDIAESVGTVVNPELGDGEATQDAVTTTVLAANVAAHVNAAVREDLVHLPAVSYWSDTPEAYVDLAAEAGYNPADAREIREAVALEAYYQSYNDKRELVADVLFQDAGGLAGHVSEQFREKLDDELATARANLSVKRARGTTFAVLDTDNYTHRFDFPPTGLLLDALHRREREETDQRLVTVGVGDDELHVRSTDPVDLRTIGERVREELPDAGVSVVGGRDGRLEFLSGRREAVIERTVAAIAERLA